MATNPYYNKVVKDNQTIIDLTSDTVAPASVLAGVTFHDASGAAQVGTATAGKTIASISPTSVPVAYGKSVVVEVVTVDNSTGDATKLTFKGDVSTEASFDVDDYSFTNFSYYNGNSNIAVSKPSGSDMLLTPSSTEAVTSQLTSAALARFTGNPMWTLLNGYSVLNERQTISSVTALMKRISTEDGLTYTAIDKDDNVTTFAYSGTYDSGIGVLSAKVARIEDTPTAYGAGYLVTYTDGTSETFVAASADIADGSY